jgi:hypothetical protein
LNESSNSQAFVEKHARGKRQPFAACFDGEAYIAAFSPELGGAADAAGDALGRKSKFPKLSFVFVAICEEIVEG